MGVPPALPPCADSLRFLTIEDLSAAMPEAHDDDDDGGRCDDPAAAKEKGNNCFQLSQYEEAIKWYTFALKLLHEKAMQSSTVEGADQWKEAEVAAAVALLNRATCHAQLGDQDRVVLDCTQSILCVSDNSKAHLRRGLAREALEKFELALEDFRKVLELESESGGSRVASEGCTRCVKAAREIERMEAQTAQTVMRTRPEQRGIPALPKPSLPQFEIRGKAGAAF